MTKDEALKMAIEVLDLNVDCVSESKWEEAINACKEALEQPDNYVFVCKHCGDELGLEWSEDTIGQITINPKEDPNATDNT